MNPSAGALAFTTFLVHEDVQTLMIYAIAVAVAVILLFVVARVLRHYFSRRTERIELPFGISPSDLDKLRTSGQLTEEELKAVRRAMTKQYLERTEAQEAARKLPPKAEAALQLAEMEATARREKEAEAQQAPGQEPAAPEQKQQPSPRTKAAEESTPPKAPASLEKSLPRRLAPLAAKSDFELEEMVQAGFLSEDDARLIRETRGGEGG